MKLIKCLDTSLKEVIIYADSIVRYFINSQSETSFVCSDSNTYTINLTIEELIKEIHETDFKIIEGDKSDITAASIA